MLHQCESVPCLSVEVPVFALQLVGSNVAQTCPKNKTCHFYMCIAIAKQHGDIFFLFYIFKSCIMFLTFSIELILLPTCKDSHEFHSQRLAAMHSGHAVSTTLDFNCMQTSKKQNFFFLFFFLHLKFFLSIRCLTK